MIRYNTNTPNDYVALNWSLTKYCEKKCHYCTSKNFVVNTKKDMPDHSNDLLEVHENIVSHLSSAVQIGHIYLVGGEPTLHPYGVEYFNKLCKETIDNPNVTIAISTHADIDDDKILKFDTCGKKEHLIVLSYHMHQVDFNEWIKKVHLFQSLGYNTIVSGIIPKQQRFWDQFATNIEYFIDNGIQVEIKSEIDPIELTTDYCGLEYLSELYRRTLDTQTEFNKNFLVREVTVTDSLGKTSVIDNIRKFNRLNLCPGKTFCQTKQFEIYDTNKLGYVCMEGPSIQLTKTTTLDDLKEFIYSPPLKCNAEFCIEPKFVPEIIVLGSTDD